jgi:hypothetical protein
MELSDAPEKIPSDWGSISGPSAIVNVINFKGPCHLQNTGKYCVKSKYAKKIGLIELHSIVLNRRGKRLSVMF